VVSYIKAPLKIVMKTFRQFFQAYSNCVNDPICGASAVQGYMNKFGQVYINEYEALIAREKIIITMTRQFTGLQR
jgi:hypothetical protein